MSGKSYLARRILEGIPVLLGLSILIFAITRIIPGDPVRLALGPSATDSQVEVVREDMGLDDPIVIQYFDWLTGVLQGDWGESLRTSSNVYVDITTRLPATLELVFVSVLFAVVLAVPFGVIAAVNKDRWPDHVSRLASLVGVSMPSFWIAIVLQVIFGAILNWMPIVGRLSDDVTPPPSMTRFYLIDSLISGQWGTFIDALHHIALPAVALSLGTLATVTRLIRSDMIEEQRKDYVMASRALGLPRNLIHYKYMLKNAFTSSLTIIGLSLGFLIGNAFLVEIVFGWPGMARYGVDAIVFQDFNAIVGVVIVVGIAFVIINTIVDLLYGYLDPRIRHTE
ncbi:ABC transporter permease [Natrialbaceae archaeon A-CW2]